ncbi:ABC transporter substrate-binding protein [Anaerocolumna sp. MB42-C2]|uniref:ABC transporter substrate-binding protein n=1 Tax=Anaerocolumna sp. MB42-C2 TaxID=3070997 RepID=UPI0027E18707|nr:extracellular solute-binding protein [Anaerocolumna sp. MB42-C2]WMJ86065.1 extracellular solute-binding protein [Anaerocolumna sp. MB42-C2]
MKKRILALILIGMMSLGSITGCSNGSSSNPSAGDGATSGDKVNTGSGDEKVTISLLNKYPEKGYVEYFQDAIADYEKANPNVTIKMENVSDAAMKDKLSVLASGGDMPDIFFSWSGEYLKKFVRAGKAIDLTTYLEKDSDWKNGFLQAFLNESTFDGKSYAIPYRSSVLYMVYNKQIFADNKLETPKTWDEFLAVCETLKKKDITPISFGDSENWYTIWWVGQLNAMLVDNDTLTKDYNPQTGTFTDSRYEKAVQYFLDLNKNGYLGENVNSKDYYQVREEFCAGLSGMIMDATSQFSFYADALGDQYGYFKIPTIEGAEGNQTAVTGGSEVYAVSSSCKNPDVAVDFIKFMTTKDQAIKQTTKTGLPNAIKGGITEATSDATTVDAYFTAEEYTNIASWLDTAVDATVADAYMTSLQEGLDGKSAGDIMKSVQEAASIAAANYK